MPYGKIQQKRPKAAETEPQKAQQIAVDDAIDDSFPASDPPAWTTTGAKSVAARRETTEENPRTADSPKRQGDKLSHSVKLAAAVPEVEDEP